MLLSRLLDEEIKRRGISIREAARQIGISNTTIIAVKNGRPLEVGTAYLITQWLGVPLTAAVDVVSDTDAMISEITSVLQTAPELTEVFKLTAEALEKGELSKADFVEIMQFAAFKIQQRRDRARYEKDDAPVPGGSDH